MLEILHDSLSQNEKTNNKIQTLIVMLCFCEKTKLLWVEVYQVSSIVKKSLTRSPYRYPDYDTEEEKSAIDDYKDSVVVIDDMLKEKNTKKLPLFHPRRQENFDVYNLSR